MVFLSPVQIHRGCVSLRTHQLPSVEMHAGQFAVVWLSDVDVEGLALINVSAAVCCHLEDGLLRDFPHGFVEILHVLRDLGNILLTSEGVFKCTVTRKALISKYIFLMPNSFTFSFF